MNCTCLKYGYHIRKKTSKKQQSPFYLLSVLVKERKDLEGREERVGEGRGHNRDEIREKMEERCLAGIWHP